MLGYDVRDGNGNNNESWVCIQNQKYGKERINKNNEKVGCSNVSINEKDIRSILQHIISDIMKDRDKILESILQIVSDVLKSDKEKDNITYFENELEKIESKKQKLLDMCLSGDIETSDYRKACERLKTEYEKISEKLQKEKAHSSMLADKEKILSEIKAYVNSIIIGEEWSDTFYRNIVDKIVVNKNREIDIHLRFIPDKWSAKILCGKAEIDRYNEKFSNQGTSQPDEYPRLEVLPFKSYKFISYGKLDKRTTKLATESDKHRRKCFTARLYLI